MRAKFKYIKSNIFYFEFRLTIFWLMKRIYMFHFLLFLGKWFFLQSIYTQFVIYFIYLPSSVEIFHFLFKRKMSIIYLFFFLHILLPKEKYKSYEQHEGKKNGNIFIISHIGWNKPTALLCRPFSVFSYFMMQKQSVGGTFTIKPG